MKLIKKSPWICFVNSGGCNGCTLETLASTTPHYDIERFGCLIKKSPRHCDILVVTGPITKQMLPRFKRILSQMAEPKYIIGVGTCALSGCVFKDSYNFEGPLDKITKVDMFIPGCPPKPEAIIDGILKLLKKIK